MINRTRKKPVVNFSMPSEMADVLDEILSEVGKKYDIKSRSELVSRVLSIFISAYEDDNFTRARDAAAELAENFKAEKTDKPRFPGVALPLSQP